MYACIHAPGNLAALIDCAAQFSPLVEETTPDDVIFDIRGLRLIFGAPRHIAEEIHRRLGVPGNVAIASNPDAAFFAARAIAGVTVIEPGKEAETLAPLPLYLLGGSPELAHTLHLWGVRTLGEFAALPPIGIAARLGDQGIRLQRLAQGSFIRQLRTRTDPLQFREEFEPETTIDLAEPLLLLAGRMFNDLCARLGAQSLATTEVRIVLKLERGEDHRVTLNVPVPMVDQKVFLKLLQLELNDRPPQAGVEKISIEMIPVAPRRTQHGLFQPPAPEPEKLEITLARIRGLVGAENVGAPELLDTHRPDAFQLARFSMSNNAKESAIKMSLRRFRPPCPAEVWCSSNGQPVRIYSIKGDWRVEACAGPWITSGDWWSQAWDRAEWDVEVATGLYRIFENLRDRQWFLDGEYD